MSCTWVGYTVVLEREPDFSAAEKALEKIKELLEPLLVAVESDSSDGDAAMDALDAAVEDMLTNPESDYIADADDVRLLISCAADSLSDAMIQWPPMHDDGDFVYVGDKIVVFAGDSTWGDSPDGEGYNLLRGLCMFKAVLKALQGEVDEETV